jgi:heme A synthase
LLGQALPTSVRLAGAGVLAAVILQWLIGMNLIWQGFPLWLGTSHNAGAALLILASLLLVRRLTPTHAAIGLAAEAR